MLKNDYSASDDIPLWGKHEYLEFDSAGEMMSWVSEDKRTFNLSHKVYEAMMDCLQNDISECIVATLEIKNQTTIDVLIRQDNFQKILKAYVERLLREEDYERLIQIKEETARFGLEI